MDAPALIAALDRFGRSLPALLAGLPTDDADWRPDVTAWSIAEIVRHLADEEVLDFRARLQRTLEDPSAEWAPIDPEGTARAARKHGIVLRSALDRFSSARRESITWLRSVNSVDWSVPHVHPKFGAIHAGDLLASWADHDALHLRQIAKRLHQLVIERAGGFSTAYAGDWIA